MRDEILLRRLAQQINLAKKELKYKEKHNLNTTITKNKLKRLKKRYKLLKMSIEKERAFLEEIRRLFPQF